MNKLMVFNKQINIIRIKDYINTFSHKLKSVFYEMDLTLEDYKYLVYSAKSTRDRIYSEHIKNDIASCIFCTHLKKSQCHHYCFSCSKQTYFQCSPLFPGTFPFVENYVDASGNTLLPWIYKSTCSHFERLDRKNFFRNIKSFSQLTTICNFEALEGLSFGICRNEKPCHICAAVNIGIYNNCENNGRTGQSKPCSIVNNEIISMYTKNE